MHSIKVIRAGGDGGGVQKGRVEKLQRNPALAVRKKTVLRALYLHV